MIPAAFITCPTCSRRHKMARPILKPETVKVVCHNCERILITPITKAEIDTFHATYDQHGCYATNTTNLNPGWLP